MNSIDKLREYVLTAPSICSTTRAILVGYIDGIECEVDGMWHALTIDAKPMTDENMAESGWVRLPKDADGEYIHVGDVMEVISSKQHAKACYMQMGPSGTWAVGLTQDCHWYDTESLRHHAPTVEDVLREFAQEMNENLGMYTGEAIDADEWRKADERTIAEYAARLRLAEREDA